MRPFLLLLSLLTAPVLYAQTPFEGEINYRFSILKKSPGFNDSTGCLQTTTRLLFKEGSFAEFPETCDMEYEYFSKQLNQQFLKLRGKKFIGVLNYEKGPSDQEPVISYEIREHTDTILGRVCNSLILQTQSAKLTFVYSPELYVNPEWYTNTQGGYYNYIYGMTKALYLKFTIETEQYTSQAIAYLIHPSHILFTDLPDVSLHPLVQLDKQ